MTGTLAQTQRPGPSRRPTRQRKALAAVLAGTSEFRSAQELHQLPG